jgi:hypothetical protein
MRMSVSMAAAALALAALATPQVGRAQSLAEIAEKEKERRKAAKKPARTFTESDLKRGGMSTFNAQVGEAPAAASEASPGPGTAPAAQGAPGAAPQAGADQRAEREKQWRQRVKDADDNVSRITTQIQKLETALNDQTVAQYGASRTNMTTQLAQAREQLGAARQTLESLQAEGRQNNFR